MDWAKRELFQLQLRQPSSLDSAFANIHTLFSNVGLLEGPDGAPTQIGAISNAIFGMSAPQKTRQTLQRLFNNFLGTLEEAIAQELDHALKLFGLFERIDKKFQVLASLAVREADTQEFKEEEMLSSLWTKILGPKAGELLKYEKNKRLLSNIRSKTLQNKGILTEHRQKLLMLKGNLDYLRGQLVKPLVRSVNASTLGIEQQMQGLEEAKDHLGRVREKQKGKLMEMLYGSGSGSARRMGQEIEGRWE